MGLIATRSLDKPVDGLLDDPSNDHEARIRSGMIGYGALMKIRAGDKSPATQRRLRRPCQGHRLRPAAEAIHRQPGHGSDGRHQGRGQDTIPTVWPLFWAFRVMVGLGFVMLVHLRRWLLAQRDAKSWSSNRWLLWLAVLAIPAALARLRSSAGSSRNSAASPGRSAGCCRPSSATSSLTSGDLIFSLPASSLFYTLLLVIEIYLMIKYRAARAEFAGLGRYHFETRRASPALAGGMRRGVMFDYATLKFIWWLLGRRVADRLRHHRRHGHGRRQPAAFRRQERHRAADRHQHRRPALGRQPGVVHHRRRRDLRRLARGLCRRLLRLLHGDAAGAVRPVFPAGRLRLPLQDRRSRAGATPGTGACFSAARSRR